MLRAIDALARSSWSRGDAPPQLEHRSREAIEVARQAVHVEPFGVESHVDGCERRNRLSHSSLR
jgi:hypothetical protein